MENLLSQFKKNIISWYPIEEKQKVLEIENSEEVVKELKKKTSEVVSIDLKHISNAPKNEFDYVVLIGILEKLSTENEILKVLNCASKSLKQNGKILLAMKNKFGMKYWSGEKFNSKVESYDTIENSNENVLSITKIKKILNNLNLKYKFYYPLPDYELTNVIYTDEFMPSNDSIDSRVITYCESGKILNFSERKAYKQLIENDDKLFPFFSNSFFIEIANSYENIKYVSYSITRKEDYRIKTIIEKNYAFKYADNDNSLKHIKNIARNIEVLENSNIKCLDKYENNKIISNYLEDAKSYDKILIDIYNKDGLNSVIEKIKEFQHLILDKLEKNGDSKNSIFEKYEITIDEEMKKNLHFIKDGVIDLIFQNCLVKNENLFCYDQEWYEENVPVEFILYRAIFYFTELKKCENIDEIYKKLDLYNYANVFEQLENKIQENILDKKIWNLHANSVKDIGKIDLILKNYEDRISATNNHIENLESSIENLESNIEQYEKSIKDYKDIVVDLNKMVKDKDVAIVDLNKIMHDKNITIDDLNKLLQDKDVELVNYANQLRTISNSLSWKITKPLRIFSWMFNPFNGASFIDRIMPPGGKRRIEYDRKQTEKKYAKKVENYFKLSDEETAEFWKGIDHRKYLKYEKNLERKEKDELSDYEKWIEENTPNDQEIEQQEKTRFRKRPKISIIIPLYNTDTEYFRELLYTVHSQTYKKWELCLADGSEKPLDDIISMTKNDKRIKYKFLGENKGISENTNQAIAMATGDYISLLDHDDILDISALYEVVKVINENKDVDFIYSDEDKFQVMDEPYYEPHFKPDYAPDTLRANNYICHYSVFKKKLMDKIGKFDSNYNGAQDFDIILKATENAKKIVHIPKVLYHWRVHKGSTSMETEAKPYAIDAGKRAVEDHLRRIGLKGKVSNGVNPGTYQIEYDIIGNPKVSILIPNRNGIDLLKTCIESVISKTTYSNYEIVIIENNSNEEKIFNYYKKLVKNPKIKVLNYNKNTILTNEGERNLENDDDMENREGFNYSRLINFGVRNTDTDFIVQLNNDTELITPNWLEKMVGFCQRKDVGAVGVKLYYPDETIQHAGIMVGCLQVAAHIFRGLPKKNLGYFGRENLIQNMNAVTAACIMTKKSIFEEVGYMNEKFAVAFNDIDFCLRIRKKGYLIVYNPFVEFTHYESKSRGNDNDPDKIERFKGEINLFLETWKEKLQSGDEYYNKNFSLDSDQYEIKVNNK